MKWKPSEPKKMQISGGLEPKSEGWGREITKTQEIWWEGERDESCTLHEVSATLGALCAATNIRDWELCWGKDEIL